MVQLQLHQRAPNFALPKLWKCMECGKEILNPKDLYGRRFCSIGCKEKFFIQL
ncbi:MAG: hypothetical protein V1777_03780 [Candidatus Micrarchaeota archaeon]